MFYVQKIVESLLEEQNFRQNMERRTYLSKPGEIDEEDCTDSESKYHAREPKKGKKYTYDELLF